MRIVEGNLIDALLENKVDCIFHCCNCRNSFGSGIAREIKERIPAAYNADKKYYQNRMPMPDDMLGHFSTGGNVINLYGQSNYGSGKQIDYGAYANALSHALRDLQESKPDIIIGFPFKIGSDRAGGDWSVVKEITEGIVKSNNVKAFWYKL